MKTFRTFLLKLLLLTSIHGMIIGCHYVDDTSDDVNIVTTNDVTFISFSQNGNYDENFNQKWYIWEYFIFPTNRTENGVNR